MPSALEYLPDDKAIRSASQAEQNAMLKQHTKHWAYWRGNQPEFLKPNGGFNDNVTLNLTRQCIQRTIDFLVPEFPHIGIPEAGNTDLEEAVWAVWKANGGAVLLHNIALNGSLDGHCYARVQPDEKGDIRIYNLDATRVVTFWDSDNIDVVLWYEVHWKVGKVAYRQDTVNEDSRWRIYEYKQAGTQWVLDREIRWDYPLPPIVDWQHIPVPNHFYGDHELTAISVQNAINKTASDVSRILRFHAFPRTVGTGFGVEDVQATGIDDFYAIENENAKVTNLEMESDLTASLNFLNLLVTNYLNHNEVVMTSGDPAAFRGMTNLGVRTTFMPMINKNEVLRRQYGYAIMNITRCILMLSNVAGWENLTVDLRWKSPLPEDERENLAIVEGEMALDLMSKRTASAKLGLDYDQERNRIDDEQIVSDVLNAGASAGTSE